MATTPQDRTLLEIDQDERSGCVITLVWDPRTDRLTLVVDDHTNGAWHEGTVPKGRCRHAMEHPFLYVEQVR